MNLTGQIIVSMPSLEDERFYKTVIYICAHSSEGSMGIIINKKIDGSNRIRLQCTVHKYPLSDFIMLYLYLNHF